MCTNQYYSICLLISIHTNIMCKKDTDNKTTIKRQTDAINKQWITNGLRRCEVLVLSTGRGERAMFVFGSCETQVSVDCSTAQWTRRHEASHLTAQHSDSDKLTPENISNKNICTRRVQTPPRLQYCWRRHSSKPWWHCSTANMLAAVRWDRQRQTDRTHDTLLHFKRQMPHASHRAKWPLRTQSKKHANPDQRQKLITSRGYLLANAYLGRVQYER